MAKHSQKFQQPAEVPPYVCGGCNLEKCEHCIDIPRMGVLKSTLAVCNCKRSTHAAKVKEGIDDVPGRNNPV